MASTKRLGDLLLESGLITRDELNKALKLQVGGNRRLGYLLIKMGCIDEEQLQAVLTEQLDLERVDIDTAFDPAVKRILPRYLCRKYNVIPLSLGDHNTLKVAMTDPSDDEAVRDIEAYTGKVVQPGLAPHSAIEAAIRRLIPWSLRDLFNPLSSQKLTALATAIALVLISVTIMQYNRDRQRALYGTRKVVNNGIVYQNHELLVEFDKSGKASLQGHGAYAAGPYSITFNDINGLKEFIRHKQNDFSADQRQWLRWALNNPPVGQ